MEKNNRKHRGPQAPTENPADI